MSKIGEVNLDLQEQANELGYDTVQEAVDHGYTVLYIKPDVVKLVSKIEYALHEAHKTWLHEKETILNKLEMAAKASDDKTVKGVISDAIKFIKRGEI